MQRKVIWSVLLVAAFLVAWPGDARAQSTIAGTARDSSGGVLPGVVVEASSEVLIEKVRSTVTDGLGQYRIIDLRPGIYVVTFTLPGFQTWRREGFSLPAEFVATIDAVMQVGAIEETITVAGGVMLVDVQSASRVQRLDRDAIDNIPSGRTIQGMGQLIVGVNLSLPDVGGSRAAMQTYMSVRGFNARQNTVMVDGMTINGLQADGAVQTYVNDAASAEMSYQTSGAGADRTGGGLSLNMIPREGGNRFSGDATFAHRPGQWQGDNLTQRFKDSGLTVVNSTNYIWDNTISQGGPVVRDKLWFFGSFRDYRTDNVVTNTYFNDGTPGSDYNYIRQGMVRLTYQVNSRNKVSAYYDRIEKFRGHDMQSNVDPETASVVWNSPNYSTGSVKWTGTLSSRLLAEVGYSQNTEWYHTTGQPGIVKPRFSEEWYANASKTSTSATLGYRTTAPATLGNAQFPTRQNIQGSVSYVTGQHNIKAGFQWQWGRFSHVTDANADLTQQYVNAVEGPIADGREITFSNPVNAVLGVPVGSVLIGNLPIVSREKMNRDMGLYVQDSWRYKRLTVNAGLRYEVLNAEVPEQAAPAGRFVPERTQPEELDLPDWRDWAPRFQVVYDVFGDAKTAVKYSFNRYNNVITTTIAANSNGISLATSTRTWADLNNDDIAQGARTWFPDGTYRDCVFIVEAGCEINLSGIAAGNPWGLSTQGALSPTFGLVSEGNVFAGYPRLYRLEHGVEVQHALHARLSVTGSFFYQTTENITKTVNTARLAPEIDYTAHTIFDPITGEPFTYYFQNAAAQSRPATNVTYLEPTAKSTFDTYQMEVRWRPTAGGQVFGGFSWERSRDYECGTTLLKADGSPAFVDPNTDRFCDDFALDIPHAVDFRLGVSYPLPWGVTFGLSYLNNDEGSLIPTYLFASTTRYPDGTSSGTTARFVNGIFKTTGQQAAPACPAPCTPGALVAGGGVYTGSATGTTVALANAGQYDAERLKQVDIKFSKTFRYRAVTISPTFEVFNITNQDMVITYTSSSYANSGGTYLRPNSLLQGRIVGWGARVAW
jgi:hypothetical protein